MSNKTKKQLKEEISQLHRDIGELIRNPDSMESIGIKFRYQFRQDFIKIIMYGSILPKSTIVGTPFSMSLIDNHMTKPE